MGDPLGRRPWANRVYTDYSNRTNSTDMFAPSYNHVFRGFLERAFWKELVELIPIG